MSEAQISSKEWLSRTEASEYLGTLGVQVSPKTLANLACGGNAGGGPSYQQAGWRTVRYHIRDLDEWATARIVKVSAPMLI